MTPKKIKWGVIGSGGIARRRTIPEGILRAKNAVLSVVYDVNPKANQETARQFKAIAADSLSALLAEDIDAVYIATPVKLHKEQAVQAARSGKHVLCEKPLGMTVAETQQMIAACRRAGVQLGTAFMMRFHSQHQTALSMIKAGLLGHMVYGRAQLSCWYPPTPGAWRQDRKLGGGGSLIDMGGHCIDLLEMFFGPAREVSCFTGCLVQKYSSEDSAVVTAKFANGAMGTVDNYFCIPDNSSKNCLELYGSRGSILCRGTIGQDAVGEAVAFIEAKNKGYSAQQSRAAAQGKALKPKPINTYQAEIEEFSDAILKKRAPANNAELGLQSQKVIAACYLSAKTGKSVKI